MDLMESVVNVFYAGMIYGVDENEQDYFEGVTKNNESNNFL